VRYKECLETRKKKRIFRRRELPGRFIVRKLFRWSDKRYDKEY